VVTRPPSTLLAVALVLVALAGAAACGSSTTSMPSASATDGPSKVTVVATTTQVADFARVVGGDCADVHGVLGPNVDPHDYEPSPADLNAMADAELIVKNGVGLERWLDDTLAGSGTTATVVDASAGVAIRQGDAAHPAGDPHIWQSPKNAITMATDIEQALTAARPLCAGTFAANLAAYRVELERLDAADETALGSLCNKKLVTNHDAFGYYVDRYGLDFVGSVIPSFDSSAELSASQIAALVTQIRAQGVKAVFSESSLPPKTAESIGREAGVTVVEGEGALYGDTLGPPGSDGATYLQMVAHNTATIVDNLRC
jgi:ABC-type Zn uptake system ZnuABC Zn-binding protein ZnuA